MDVGGSSNCTSSRHWHRIPANRPISKYRTHTTKSCKERKTELGGVATARRPEGEAGFKTMSRSGQAAAVSCEEEKTEVRVAL